MHRSRPMIAAAACLFAAGTAAAAGPLTDAEISALVAKYAGTAIAERQDLHKNPELSNRETRTGELVAKRLKSQGYRFVGPTSVYAFMQNVGVVNDHVRGCFRATN